MSNSGTTPLLQLVTDQRPVLDQLVVIDLPRHARTLLPHYDVALTRASVPVCGW
jgi:hypothetical protein